MKKIILAFCLGIASFAFGQQPVSNLYQQTQPLPLYAPVATGGGINWAYNEPAVPLSTHDTLHVVTNAAFTVFKIDSLRYNAQHTTPFVINADTTGDTLLYATLWNNKTWYKKTPFITNRQVDKITFYFNGSKGAWTTVKFGANFNCGTLTGDTIHIAKTSTAGGFANAEFHFDFQRMAYVLDKYATW